MPRNAWWHSAWQWRPASSCARISPPIWRRRSPSIFVFITRSSAASRGARPRISWPRIGRRQNSIRSRESSCMRSASRAASPRWAAGCSSGARKCRSGSTSSLRSRPWSRAAPTAIFITRFSIQSRAICSVRSASTGRLNFAPPPPAARPVRCRSASTGWAARCPWRYAKFSSTCRSAPRSATPRPPCTASARRSAVILRPAG